MMIHEITKLAGAHPLRMRVGRGPGSDKGKQCGRGNKGCLARSGGGPRLGYEGGQMPLIRRLPKRGFSNDPFRMEYDVVNVGDLARHFQSGAVVDPKGLWESRLVRQQDTKIKLLGDGAVDRPLSVQVHRASKSAIEKIAAAGGKVELIKA